MDAHTLNAWTRFALQKGGIGTCTALIDNPATELEDLMFMTGEKIIVLRRLDEDGNDAGTSSSSNGKRKSVNDADSWFLGYCEGVVGRFKGSHTQFHGKLKKPVLMRRSGVGSIRESTTQPMSKSEAATMDVSQVPLGIPITAVDSDGEEEDSMEGYANGSAVSTNGSRRASTTTANSKGSTPLAKLSASNMPKNQRNNRLGVTTPPLSDESHARRVLMESADSDSDDSSTKLPWARNSLSSTKSSRVASTDYTHETNGAQAGAASSLLGQKGPILNQKDGSNHLPPSPISSAESPIHARSLPKSKTAVPNGKETPYNYAIPRIRGPGFGHTSNQSSIATTTTSTSESEEDSNRRDQTFSIYDVYGRDSVAFPNFDFANINDKTNRLNTSTSSDSLSARSNSPRIQALSARGVTEGNSLLNKPIPAALRTPSGRRPTAAPALPALATGLRRKVEANGNASVTSPLTSPISSPNMDNSPQFGNFNFDPKRRPSLGNQAPVQGSRFAPRINMPPIIDTSGATLGTNNKGVNGGTASYASSETNSMPRSPITPVAASSSSSSPITSQPPALGTTIYARRMQEATAIKVAVSPAGLQPDVQPTVNVFQGREDGSLSSDSLRSPNRPMASSESTIGQNSPTTRPIRSSSDRSSSTRDPQIRIGSGQLKKNPSNPQPGPHGGLFGLVAPSPAYVSNGGLTTPTGSSRSPSPLSVPSPTSFSPGPLSSSPNGSHRSPIGSHMSIGSNRPAMPGNTPMGPPPRSPIGATMPIGPPGPRVLSNAGSFQGFRGVNPATVSFDSMGFVVGSGFNIPEPKEDPEEVQKWNQLLAENDLISAKKSRKVKKMVQAGIPQSMRAKVWPYLANSYVRRRAGLFEELCKTSQSAKGKKGKEASYDAIDKDLDRAFPDHRLFMGEVSTGRADLEAILKAYVHYNPIVGYTQGMSLVAGFLLIQMPAEDAFWMLCALLRDVHMEGYYANEMKQLHVDGIVFGQLLQAMDPPLASRLTEMSIEPINFAPSWFLPLFTRIVPWQTLLRTWDLFLFEGPTWILRTALGIIRIVREPLMDRRVCPEGGEALQLLLHPPQNLLTPENVIPCALSVKLKDGEMRKLSRQASKLVRSSFNQTRGRPLNEGDASVSRSLSAPASKRS